MTSTGNEVEMIERILKGEKYLVADLFRPYDVRARAIARRFLHQDESRIEDVVQESTMKAYLNLPKLRNRERFGSWFLTIVRNKAIDSAKRENIYFAQTSGDEEKDFESWISNQCPFEDEPCEKLNLSELTARMMQELFHLDRTYGEPIRMLYFEDMTYSEIADILHKPLGTVKSLIHRGKAILKDRIYGGTPAAA
jgi:RNA polymerase sigma-70 factor (ECF subfamily)